MSEPKWVNHPNAPHNQPFNVGARPNQTKKGSWWNAGSSNFWRSKKSDKSKKQDKE